MIPSGNFNGMNNQNQGMGSNIVEQEIQNHKNQLNNFIIKLNNTHNIDEEILINNKIKIETECLLSLLNIKRNELNQFNFQNNNINNNNFFGAPFAKNMNNNVINTNIQMPGMMYNKEWLKGFKMGVEEEINNGEEINTGPKIHVLFKTTRGVSIDLSVDYDTTIDKLLEKYLKRVNRPDLIGDKNNKIVFLFNACQLRFGDQTPVENFFKGIHNPVVIVNDIDNLRGG